MYTKMILFFSGFRQPKHISNGCLEMCDRFNATIKSDGHTNWEARYWPWDVLPQMVADVVAEELVPDGELWMAAHSYGVHTEAKVQELAYNRDHRVTRFLFSIDGIHQGDFGKRLQLIKTPITLGPGIDYCLGWRQQNSFVIRGSKLIVDPATRYFDRPMQPCKHAQMDELADVQRTIYDMFFGI